MALYETGATRGEHKTSQRDAGIRHRKWSQISHGVRDIDSMTSNDSGTKRVNIEKYFGYKNTVPDHITIFKKDEALKAVLEDEGDSSVVTDIYALLTHPPKTVYAQQKAYQALLRRAAVRILALEDIKEAAVKEIKRHENNVGERSRKRWTPEDDELLIETAAQENATIFGMAKAFGRTPAAIQSRITHLVGIKRMSAEIAGRFVGTLNGEFVEGDIDGTVSKGGR